MGLFSNLIPEAKEIRDVKVLGVRAAQDTKVLATYNSTIYCLAVLYVDGSRELVEVGAKSMEKYLRFLI